MTHIGEYDLSTKQKIIIKKGSVSEDVTTISKKGIILTNDDNFKNANALCVFYPKITLYEKQCFKDNEYKAFPYGVAISPNGLYVAVENMLDEKGNKRISIWKIQYE